MTRILLACSAGISTSLIVEKMKKIAKEQNKDYKIWATAVENILDDDEPFDVVLIGPQVSSKFDRVVEITQEFGDDIPVGVIEKEDYGRMRAEKILAEAEKLLGK